jgi:hypothetical protein
VWPLDTNLVYTDGSNKLKLTLQHPLVLRVIQNAIENFGATLLFSDAFPDATVSLTFAKNAFLLAAKAHFPATQDIHIRLLHNLNYITQINRVVHVTGCAIAVVHTILMAQIDIIRFGAAFAGFVARSRRSVQRLLKTLSKTKPIQGKLPTLPVIKCKVTTISFQYLTQR